MENDFISLVWNLSMHNTLVHYRRAIVKKLSHLPKNTCHDNDFSANNGIGYYPIYS
jgi:hypothetical protein